MKLFRLITEDANGVFNNTLNEDLVIPPDSKIALQSLSMETKNDVIIVDSSNDEISFQVSTGFPKVIQLTHATYNKDNYFDLLDDIKNKFNEATGFDATTTPVRRNLGLEWICDVNPSKKISIEYRIGANGEHVADWNYNNTQVERVTDLTRNVWRRKPLTTGGNNNSGSVLFNHFISRGCSFIRGRTHKLVAPTPTGTQAEANGYMIGLSSTNISQLSPSDITDDMLTYGIHVAYDSGGVARYYTVLDGVLTQSAITTPTYVGAGDVNNDFQEVTINFDAIDFNVYKQSPASNQLLASVPYPAGTKLYPFMVFRGTNASINLVRTIPSPFSSIGDAVHIDDGNLGSPPVPQRNPSENYLQLNEDLARFFGYNNPRQPQVGFIVTVQHNYVANKAFDPEDLADSFIVELLNLKCDSYDGLLNQRKNILGVVPKSNAGGTLIYEMNNPIFIDLNNRSDILLRNLRVRVVKPDYSPISMLGQATMVVLLSS